jgi:hypothetical protein
MKILEVHQYPSTLVIIVKLLRQAFTWYHWHSDWALSDGTIGILIGTDWGQMFHFWKFSQNNLSP